MIVSSLVDDVEIAVCRANASFCSVHLRDLPTKVYDDDVRAFFSAYDAVSSPSLKIYLVFFRVRAFDCRVWYTRQPAHYLPGHEYLMI